MKNYQFNSFKMYTKKNQKKESFLPKIFQPFQQSQINLDFKNKKKLVSSLCFNIVIDNKKQNNRISQINFQIQKIKKHYSTNQQCAEKQKQKSSMENNLLLELEEQQKQLEFHKFRKKNKINYQSLENKEEKKLYLNKMPYYLRKKLQKLEIYLDFLYHINLSNRIYHPLKITSRQIPFKVFVAKGNNSNLIKNCLKKRFWWSITQMYSNDVNFVWSQNKNINYLNSQTKASFLPIKYEDYTRCINMSNQIQKQEQIFNYFSNIFNIKDLQLLKKIKKKPKYYFKNLNYPVNLFSVKLHNHFIHNWNLTNKKALFHNLYNYYKTFNIDPFSNIPFTFHIKEIQDQHYKQFKIMFNYQKQKLDENNVWIIKPGENSNRGKGITVTDNFDQIYKILQCNLKPRTIIIQKYIKPFLYMKRKFDIRIYMLVTCVNNIIKAYLYQQGYIRTCSKQFNLKNLDNNQIHLTNDAIQKKSENYGKYENCNKLSLNVFYRYLKREHPKLVNKYQMNTLPRIQQLATDAIKSTFHLLNPNYLQYCFEIYGLDFMIDFNFDTWLIQVNNNPNLQQCCPLLARLIPAMIENCFKVAIDPIFIPPLSSQSPVAKIFHCSEDSYKNNKLKLIFDSLMEGNQLLKLLQPYMIQGKILQLVNKQLQQYYIQQNKQF